MPELPEVETMRRGILAVEGGRVEDVAREPCSRRPIAVTPRIDALRRRAVGQVVRAVGRIGKRVVLALSDGDQLVIEPRMTGLVLLSDPPSVEHLRLRIELSGCGAKRIWFWDRRGLGTVRLVRPEESDALLGPQRIGPDALTVTTAELRQRMSRSRRAIKVALLDQSLLAGVGNLYASEILHVAGIHPQRRCEQLAASQWQRLTDAIQLVLQEAIRHEGSTLSDGTYRNALNQAGGYQNHHRVYDRQDKPCPRCGDVEILRIVQAQRSTFFCPQCQRNRR